MRKPSGSMRCSAHPVAAHKRATLPVLGGISGSTSARCKGAPRTSSSVATRSCGCLAKYIGELHANGCDDVGNSIVALPNALDRRSRVDDANVGGCRIVDGTVARCGKTAQHDDMAVG